MNVWFWVALAAITTANLSVYFNVWRNGATLSLRKAQAIGLLLVIATGGLALSHAML